MRFTWAVLFGAEKAVETLQEHHRGKRWALHPPGWPCLQELSCESRAPRGHAVCLCCPTLRRERLLETGPGERLEASGVAVTATATSGRLQSWLGASAAADALRVSTRPTPPQPVRQELSLPPLFMRKTEGKEYA